jgi:hypothetical protein
VFGANLGDAAPIFSSAAICLTGGRSAGAVRHAGKFANEHVLLLVSRGPRKTLRLEQNPTTRRNFLLAHKESSPNSDAELTPHSQADGEPCKNRRPVAQKDAKADGNRSESVAKLPNCEGFPIQLVATNYQSVGTN